MTSRPSSFHFICIIPSGYFNFWKLCKQPQTSMRLRPSSFHFICIIPSGYFIFWKLCKHLKLRSVYDPVAFISFTSFLLDTSLFGSCLNSLKLRWVYDPVVFISFALFLLDTSFFGSCVHSLKLRSTSTHIYLTAHDSLLSMSYMNSRTQPEPYLSPIWNNIQTLESPDILYNSSSLNFHTITTIILHVAQEFQSLVENFIFLSGL